MLTPRLLYIPTFDIKQYDLEYEQYLKKLRISLTVIRQISRGWIYRYWIGI